MKTEELKSLIDALNPYIQSCLKRYKTYKVDTDLYQVAISTIIKNSDKKQADLETLIKCAIDFTAKEIIQQYQKQYVHGTKEERKAAAKFFLDALELYIRDIMSSQYSSYYKDWDDMYQEAVLMILQKIPDYNSDLGTLTTFFTSYIQEGIRRVIRKAHVRTTPYYYLAQRKIDKAAENFQKKYGIEPTIEDLAAELNMKVFSILRILRVTERATEVSLTEEIVSTKDNIEENLIQLEEKKELIDAVNTLDTEAKKILLYWVNARSYIKTADAFHKSTEYIRISIEDSLIQLRRILNPRFQKNFHSKIVLQRTNADPDLLSKSKFSFEI